jgi:hypothetical protein
MDVDLSTRTDLAQRAGVAAARPGRAAEVTVLLIANLAATAIRSCLYRARVSRRPRPAQAALIHPEGTDR